MGLIKSFNQKISALARGTFTPTWSCDQIIQYSFSWYDVRHPLSYFFLDLIRGCSTLNEPHPSPSRMTVYLLQLTCPPDRRPAYFSHWSCAEIFYITNLCFSSSSWPLLSPSTNAPRLISSRWNNCAVSAYMPPPIILPPWMMCLMGRTLWGSNLDPRFPFTFPVSPCMIWSASLICIWPSARQYSVFEVAQNIELFYIANPRSNFTLLTKE